MARAPRSLTVFPGHVVHKVWRGHNKERNLGTDSQKAAYLEFMNRDLESKKYEQGSTIAALTLMCTHSHEMDGITNQPLFSKHMQRHHAQYGAWFNKENDRCGKVAQDRPYTTLLEGEQQEMETSFYIHANPIRANMVRDMRNYYWSTFKLYAYGKREPWMRNVKLPDWYMALGRTDEQRQHVYRQLFARYLEEKGRFKQNFLKKRFFGSPLWVRNNEQKLSEWRRDHSPP